MMCGEYECVEGVPSGLIGCTLGGTEAHIARISPRALWLRVAAPLAGDAPLILAFYHPEQGAYTRMEIQYDRAEPVQCDDRSALVRLSISDGGYAAAVRRALADYARYVECMDAGGAALCGQMLTGYPADGDEDFHADLQSQWSAWFGDGASLVSDTQSRETALLLGDPELCAAFLRRGEASVWEFYAHHRGVPRSILPEEPPQRLYIGSASCTQLLPDAATLDALLDAAERADLAVTLLLPPLRTGDGASLEALLRHLESRREPMELSVNDWGALELLQGHRDALEPVLGPLLNKLRRDPRMQWKAGSAVHNALLAQSNFNDPHFLTFLRGFGIRRLEYECCDRAIDVPEGHHSLHLPFYHTNTSAWCTLRALCERGDRGMQGPAAHCPHWCARNAQLYPKQLNLIGRGNALLALDRSVGAHIPAHIDRLVYNL